MGVCMLLQPGFGRRHIGDIDRGADDAGIAQRDFGEGQSAALSADHREALGFLQRVFRTRDGSQVALALVQRHLFAAGGFHVLDARAFEERMVAPGQGEALVAQPDRNGQGVEDGFVFAAFLRHRRLFQPHRGHAAHGAAACRQLAAVIVFHAKLERRAAFGQAIERSGQCQGIWPLEAGLQHLFAAAIGERSGAVAAPDHQRLAARAQERVALPHRRLGLGPYGAQRAAQAAGGALFGQRP